MEIPSKDRIFKILVNTETSISSEIDPGSSLGNQMVTPVASNVAVTRCLPWPYMKMCIDKITFSSIFKNLTLAILLAKMANYQIS